MPGIDGLTPYSGDVSYGLRNFGGRDFGGENARWGLDASGREQPLFGGYLYSDLINKFGSVDAIRNYGRLDPNSTEWAQKQAQMGEDQLEQQYFDQGPFARDIDLFNARGSDDPFTGPAGWGEVASIGSLFLSAYMGGAYGGAEGFGPEVAGGGEVGSGYAASAPGDFGGGIYDFPEETSGMGGEFDRPGRRFLGTPEYRPDMFETPSFFQDGGGADFNSGFTGEDSALFGGDFVGDLETVPFDPTGPMPANSSFDRFMNSILGREIEGSPEGSVVRRRSPLARYGAGGLSLFSGYQGLRQAKAMEEMARQAQQTSDPFGPERAKYAAELDALRKDPSRVQSLPGYKAGLQAVERRMAAQGYQGSGNMAVALQDYGGRAYDNEVARLAALAGAGISPNPGPAINALSSASRNRSQALASLAFGAMNFF